MDETDRKKRWEAEAGLRRFEPISDNEVLTAIDRAERHREPQKRDELRADTPRRVRQVAVPPPPYHRLLSAFEPGKSEASGSRQVRHARLNGGGHPRRPQARRAMRASRTRDSRRRLPRRSISGGTHLGFQHPMPPPRAMAPTAYRKRTLTWSRSWVWRSTRARLAGWRTHRSSNWTQRIESSVNNYEY